MSLFGKFMAVLNFLGVTAVIVMALMVYAKRTAWQYTNFRHQLAIDGLPISDADVDDDNFNRSRDLGSLTGSTLADLFPSNPVTTQLQEVERVKKIIDSKVAALSDNPQIGLLAITLLPLADSAARREYLLTVQNLCSNAASFQEMQKAMEAAYPRAVQAYNNSKDPQKTFARELALALRLPGPVPHFDDTKPENTPPKGIEVLVDTEPRGPFEEAFARAIQPDAAAPPNFAKKFEEAFPEAVEAVRGDLKARYDAAFQEALVGQHTADGKAVPLSQEQRRHVIARLLVALEDSIPKDTAPAEDAINTDAFSSPPFMRVLKIIGVKEMAAELNSQAVQLTRISEEYDRMIVQERTHFAMAHATLIDEAQSVAHTIGQQDDQLRRMKDRVAEQTTLVAQREKNIADAKAELARRRQYTTEMIGIVQKMQDSIHQTRIEVRDANELNQTFAEKIRKLEQGKTNSQP
jgi:hypothetical protein